MEPKTRKRIVSKGEYARQVVTKSILLFLGAIVSINIFVCLRNLLRLWLTRPEGIPVSIGFAFICVAAVMLACYGLTMATAIRGVRRIHVDVPLTRANTANLPAPDSLVRASSEPMQVQQTVLLRAAAEGMETPPEQIARTVIGEKT